ENCKLGKPELPPQAPGHLVLRKDQVEDHAPIPKFLRILQHHGPQEPAQPPVAPLGRHHEPRVGDVARPARPVRLEIEGAASAGGMDTLVNSSGSTHCRASQPKGRGCPSLIEHRKKCSSTVFSEYA